jgi:pimeloyl-ACP methyl ester carboxylesterase
LRRRRLPTRLGSACYRPHKPTEKERIIPKSARRRDQLPPHTREIVLPNCGHLMQWDDPALVAQTILDATDVERRAAQPA